MNVLTIETSNQVLGVSIVSNETLIGELTTNIPKTHSLRLMPAIVQLMKDVEMKPGDLNKIVVANGPGSYTGVRIGVTTAKTLAWSLNIPVVGISSLEALAYQGRFFNGFVCPFIDARRQTVFTGLYRWSDDRMVLYEQERHISMEDWLMQVKNENQDILFLSPHIDLYKELILEHLGNVAIIPEDVYHISKPSHLELAARHKQPDDTHLLVPNYLRLAEAEAKWMKEQEEKKRND